MVEHGANQTGYRIKMWGQVCLHFGCLFRLWLHCKDEEIRKYVFQRMHVLHQNGDLSVIIKL